MASSQDLEYVIVPGKDVMQVNGDNANGKCEEGVSQHQSNDSQDFLPPPADYSRFFGNLVDAIALLSGRAGQNKLTAGDAELFVIQNSKWLAKALKKFAKQNDFVKRRERERLSLGRSDSSFARAAEMTIGQEEEGEDVDRMKVSSCDKKVRVLSQEEVYDLGKAQLQSSTTCLTRHEAETCFALDRLDREKQLNTQRLKLPQDSCVRCYMCGCLCLQPHSVYLFCCRACGDTSQKNRSLSRDLSGQVAVVVGGRTKVGHQIVLKLLRAGCGKVVCTTRYAQRAMEMFQRYEVADGTITDYAERLVFVGLDLDCEDVVKSEGMKALLMALGPENKVDVLVNCAAQTIRARDKPLETSRQMKRRKLCDDAQTNDAAAAHAQSTGSFRKTTGDNRYGDSRFVHTSDPNSWSLKLADISSKEMMEVYRVSAMGPVLVMQQLLPYLSSDSYVINVHAREGLLGVSRNDIHLHTNMAKAALAMFTSCIAGAKAKHAEGATSKLCRVHGCDPGWFSVDEYYEEQRPWVVPPLDEVDAAARVLYPLWKKLPTCAKTRRHFDQFAV